MLKVFNDTARFINQGGKRNGSIAIYMEPWHADIEDFLEMKKNHGDDEMRHVTFSMDYGYPTFLWRK